jgi:CRISPR-associated protein Cmr1
MQVIEADYNIVTPMFIGGADKTDTPDIRPPSIKGALRFWWRALQWGACLNLCNQNASAALKELHKQEAELFGAAVKEEAYGQGKVLLKVKAGALRTSIKNTPNQPARPSGQAYLLGQGLYHHNQRDLRASITANQSFKVVLKLQDDVDATSLQNALLAFGLLGGLGSRARKGWGSVAIKALTYTNTEKQVEQIAIPHNKATFKQCLSDLLSKRPASLPPFTAFSQQTLIDISAESSNAEGLLTSIGAEMQMYRSYGQNQGNGHRVNGMAAEQNFAVDHDLVYSFIQNQAITQHPRRVVFGLPHNYFFSNGVGNADVNGETFSRRASPLLIHIHQFPTGDCLAVQTLLPAQFLPVGERIQLKRNHRTTSIPCDIDWQDWQVITTYLGRFNNRERII